MPGTQIGLIDFYQLNPMETFVAIFRNLLYDNRLPSADVVFVALLWTAVTATVGFGLFAKKEKQMAELL